MHDSAFQQLVLEELKAMRIGQEALRKEFTNFRLDEFTKFKLEVVEERGFQKGKSYFVPGVVSVVVSAIVSFIYKFAFK